MSLRDDERGQASVELVALLPLLAGLVLACWQGVVAGESWWLAATSARAAARADVIGSDPQAAARSALPQRLRGRLRVVRGADGRLVVRMRVPAVVGTTSLWTVAVAVAGAKAAS